MVSTKIRRSRLPVFLFLLCFTLLLFSACSKTDAGTGSIFTITETAEEAPAEVLTAIFAETVCEVPENARVSSAVLPYYDHAAGTISVFLQEIEETTDENGVIGERSTGWIYTITPDGSISAKEQIPLHEDSVAQSFGAVLPDAFIYAHSTKQEGAAVFRTDRITGETSTTGKIHNLLNDPEFSLYDLTVDADGRIYGTNNSSVFVLNPDLTLAFTYVFPNTISDMARGSDGAVWVTYNAGMDVCTAKIDPETKCLGDICTFTRGMELGKTSYHLLIYSTMNAGDSAYNFFYNDRNGMIWGVTVLEDGSLAETQVFDLFNSGISKLEEGRSGGSGQYPIAFLTDTLFMSYEYRYSEEKSERTLFLHHKTDDIDMSDQSVITIAYAYPLAAATVDQIAEFKRTRPNLNIVLEDYSQYATVENSRAGEEKLCFDLVNGFIKPDILITDSQINTLSDDMVMTQLCRSNLYVDLVPYLETDDTLNFDNLFGCIRRLFDDGKGGMWGISDSVSVATLIGSSKFLGDYAEKGCWSLNEMLDFFDSLPEDTEKYYGLVQLNKLKSMLFAEGYGYFTDSDSCSFDSDEFIRYLEYLKTLPKDYIEWKQMSPVADIHSLSGTQQEAAVNDALAIGKIGLNAAGINYRYIHDLLFSEETFPIGYATKNDSGFGVKAGTTYSITTFAEEPDLCFELLKTFFVCKEKYIGAYNYYWPLFARKDHFETALIDQTTPTETQLMSDEEYRAYCKKYGLPYAPRAKAPVPLTDEETAAIFDLFDSIGSPIMEMTPTAVAEIVEEEISAFLSGMGTAEDCAGKIQSRVEIWLAEHE